MAMYGPSGTCPPNNDPCFTAGDLANYTAALAVKQAEIIVAQATVTNLQAQAMQIMNEQIYANTHKCP